MSNNKHPKQTADSKNLSPTNPPKQGQQEMEKIAAMVIDTFAEYCKKLKDLKPEVNRIQWWFKHQIKAPSTLAGCGSFKEFCEKKLHRTEQAVYAMLGDYTEKAKKKKNGNSHSELGNKATDETQAERGEIKTGQELLSEHANSLLSVLADKSIKDDAMRVKRAAGMVVDLQRTIEEGKLFAPPVPPPPQPPPILGDPVPEPDPGSLEELRQRISRMADTDEIDETLKEFLEGLVKPLLENHAYAPSLEITVEVSRSSRSRIAVGDWVEYTGGDSRLSKQTGLDKSLGRVVSEDKLGRPQILWNSGRKWKQTYSLFSDSDFAVHVLFDYQADAQFPEAFRCYPTDTEGKKTARKAAKSAAGGSSMNGEAA